MTDDEQQEDGSQVAPTDRISIGELRARAQDPDDKEAAAAVERMSAKVRGAMTVFPSNPNMAAVDALRASSDQAAEHRQHMDDALAGIAEVNEAKRVRAQKQTDATVEIADAQIRLQELQSQALVLAAEQAAATARVAETQQALLVSHSKELEALQAQAEALKAQHETLQDQARTQRQQADDQRRLVHSGFWSGVVMEWTLAVALLAFVATALFAAVPPEDITNRVWCSLAGGLAFGAIALAVWQWRRRPKDE